MNNKNHFTREPLMKHLYHLLIIVVLGATPNTFAEKQQMSVLFLIIDDLNTWLHGDENRYGGKVIAPNITKLGKSGIVFQHAYTASPVCAPSRTALWSGMRPWQTGVYQNGVDSRQSKALKKATSLPKLFKQAGYFTASHGKVTHGWDTRSGFDERTPHRSLTIANYHRLEFDFNQSQARLPLQF